MAMWLYQLSEREWSSNNYRLDVWERERWEWRVGRVTGSDVEPQPGDTVVFFYAPSGCKEPGFYGWAVILLWFGDQDRRFYFRPVPPSDLLKMSPWWDHEAREIANKVRGGVKQGTLWRVPDDLVSDIGTGMRSWSGGASSKRETELIADEP